jgi:hypothetical protein
LELMKKLSLYGYWFLFFDSLLFNSIN